ncbi:hypothetical protein NP233_g9397 [Leucocoprinus birnbaumii]|uniref:Uncharacterized protein n=1 Tax=Leucocoprinus birnbaumii TaxID=56174 RepID=A0AAD5YSW4_9AGAR|nr:hypothetical protein NP233_g9397 [Leucocoprinus birnbaumii]
MSSDASGCGNDPFKGKEYKTKQLGIWEVLYLDQGLREQYQNLIHDFFKLFPSFYRLFRDIYNLSPKDFPSFAIYQGWLGCQEAIKLHFSNKLLKTIELCLKNGEGEYSAILQAVALRLGVPVLGRLFSWYNTRNMEKLQRRVTTHFQIRLMRAKLGHDLAHKNTPTANSKVSAALAWTSFTSIVRHVSYVMTVMTQLALILHLSASGDVGPFFAFICLIQPIVYSIMGKSLWNEGQDLSS